MILNDIFILPPAYPRFLWVSLFLRKHIHHETTESDCADTTQR